MPAREAFIFCNVTGAGYLDNFVFPFSPKGLMKLFYNAFDFKFVSGVFEKTSLRYTPLLLSKAKPFLFDSQYKYIIPIEFNSEIELQSILERAFDKIEKPTDYIIMRIETSKKGNGLESFMEYLAGEYFKKQGFIVENQVPLAHAIGSPDFGGYDLSNIQTATQKYLPYGFHIIELAMLRLNNKVTKYKISNNYPYNLIVGEAKTSTKIMDSQLRKYLDTGLFDWGFEIHPNKAEATRNDRGMFTLDENYKIRFIPATNKYEYSKGTTQLSKNEYILWLENYMKFYLIANFTNDELNDFYKSKTNESIDSQYNLVEFIKSISAKEIVSHIEILENGIIK
jgi:hypothetical protein